MRSSSLFVAFVILALSSGLGAAVAQPGLSINNRNVTEGNAGSADAVLTVTLSAAATGVVTVGFATENQAATGGAACGGATDYITESGTVQFNPGQVSQTIGIAVCGDAVGESDEIFRVRLSNASGATIQDAEGRVTINNDDAAATPSVSIGDATAVEGNTGTTALSFTATLSASSTQAVTVGFATTPVSAVQGASCGAGVDLASATGALTFNPGVTSQPVAVSVCGDGVDESNETFDVVLSSPVGATIADGSGRGTITDDDAAAPPQPSLSINDVLRVEGSTPGTQPSMLFTVTLSAASSQPVTVQFATSVAPPVDQKSNCSDPAPDLRTAQGTLSFDTGITVANIIVFLCADTENEADEFFDVVLSNPVGATIADGTGRGLIKDDDLAQPRPEIGESRTVDEGTGGTTQVIVNITLSEPPDEQPVIVNFNVSTETEGATLGTCAGGADLVTAGIDVQFFPGETTKPVALIVCADGDPEGDESFRMTASGPGGQDTATLTIRNDDFLPALTINDVTFQEGSSVNAVLTVSLSLPAPAGIQLAPTTAPFSRRVPPTQAATSGLACGGPADFRALVTQFPIPTGATSVAIPVQICDDAVAEGREGLTVTIQPMRRLTVADGVGIIEITDND